MKRLTGIVLIALLAGCGRAPATARVYDPSADAHADVAKALGQSHVDGRRVLLIFGANWCVACRVLDGRLRERAAQLIVARSFHVVDIDIGEGDDTLHGSACRNLDIARRFGVRPDRGVPAVAVIDEAGHAVYAGVVPYTNFGGWSPDAGPRSDDVVAFLTRWATQ